MEAFLGEARSFDQIFVPVAKVFWTRNLNTLIPSPDIQILPNEGYAVADKFVIFHNFAELLQNNPKKPAQFLFQLRVAFDNPEYAWEFSSQTHSNPIKSYVFRVPYIKTDQELTATVKIFYGNYSFLENRKLKAFFKNVSLYDFASFTNYSDPDSVYLSVSSISIYFNTLF